MKHPDRISAVEFRETIGKPKRKRRRVEDGVQKQIIAFLKLRLPSSARAIHIHNTPRNAIDGARLKKMGLTAGAADIVIIRDGGVAAFLEVKAPKGSQSAKQHDFSDWCGANQVPYAVVRNVSDVETFLSDLNIPLRREPPERPGHVRVEISPR